MMLQTLAINWQSLGMGLLIVLFLIFSTLLILTVLIQKPQGGGLAGAFGSGAGSGQTAFGAKTGDALTWATIIMFVVWLVTSVGLNLAFRPAEPGAEIEATGTTAPAPTDTPVGAPQGAAPGTPAETPTTEPATPPADAPPAQPEPQPTEPAPEPTPEPEPAQPEG